MQEKPFGLMRPHCSFDENFYLITIFQFWSKSSISKLTHTTGLKNEREPGEEKDG